ncbi:hypothetical protein ACWJJH_03050 [Endozoicomonadaceae bacterium StTr2]
MISIQKTSSKNHWIHALLFLLLATVNSAFAALNTDSFNWDSWFHLTSSTGENIKIKFTQKSTFTESSVLHVTREPSSASGGKSKTISFQLEELPNIPDENGQYLIPAQQGPEFPPLVAVGFSLLFMLEPQLATAQESVATPEQHNRFIQSCTALPRDSMRDKGLTITGKKINTGANKFQPRIIISLSSSVSMVQTTEDQIPESVYCATYEIHYLKGGEQKTVTYTLSNENSEVPFLTSSLAGSYASYVATSAYEWSHLTQADSDEEEETTTDLPPVPAPEVQQELNPHQKTAIAKDEYSPSRPVITSEEYQPKPLHEFDDHNDTKCGCSFFKCW